MQLAAAVNLPERAWIWAMLLSLGGVSYITGRGALGLAQVRDSTLSAWSPVEFPIEGGFLGRSYDDLQNARPGPAGGMGEVREWPSHTQEEVELEQIRVQTPAPVEGRITHVAVAGFSGLAPPRLTVRLRVWPAAGATVPLGEWPVRLTASALLKPAYWKPHLDTAAREAESQEKVPGAGAGRARMRRADIEAKRLRFARPLTVECRGVLDVRSTSRFLGLSARGLSLLLGAVALITGGTASLVALAYAKILIVKESDIEP